MAHADPTGFAQRFFVERRSDDRPHVVVEGVTSSALDVLITRSADLGAHVPAANLLNINVVQIDQVDDAWTIAYLTRRVDGAHFEGRVGDGNGGLEHASVADD